MGYDALSTADAVRAGSELRPTLPPPGGRRLLLAVHDVAPAYVREIEALIGQLGFGRDLRGLALLVVPQHWRSHPIAPGTAFTRWLRELSDNGAEVLLHGWTHRQGEVARGPWARFKASRLTAGEGEFLVLSAPEALRRLRDGRSLLEDILGAPVEGFVAPAWLYGEGAITALTESGFRIAETHFKVWNPQSGAALARGPVITWASRSRARTVSSLAVASAARVALGHSAVVRIGVHPPDASVPALTASIGRTVRHFRRTHALSRYADLL